MLSGMRDGIIQFHYVEDVKFEYEKRGCGIRVRCIGGDILVVQGPHTGTFF